MGTFAKDNYEIGQPAALVGGTTTLIEMCCPARAEDPLEAFELWLSKADRRLGLRLHLPHGRVPVRRRHRRDSCARSSADGIASLQSLPGLQRRLRHRRQRALQDPRAGQGTRRDRHRPLRKRNARGRSSSSSCSPKARRAPSGTNRRGRVAVEAEGVHHLMTFAEADRRPRLRRPHELRAGRRRRSRRQGHAACNAWIETVIPYLVLDKIVRRATATSKGAKYVMSPPHSRQQPQQDVFCGTRSGRGSISTVATDHAPFDFAGQKEMGRDDFTPIPNGIPSRRRSRQSALHPRRRQRTASTSRPSSTSPAPRPPSSSACIPRKGTIASAATPIWSSTTRLPRHRSPPQRSHMDVDYSAFEGWDHRRPADAWSPFAARSQVRDGEFVGQMGHGKLLERECTHG